MRLYLYLCDDCLRVHLSNLRERFQSCHSCTNPFAHRIGYIEPKEETKQ